MAQSPEPVRYRIAVFISGVQTQYFYAWGEAQRATQLRAAIKALTNREPGANNGIPRQVVVEKRLRIISGKKSSWEVVQTVPYENLPDEQLEWKQRKLRRDAAIKDVQEAEAALGAPAAKPPLGLMPRKLWEEQRLIAVAQAMERYNAANMTIPNEWHEELHDLTQRAELCQTCRQAAVVCAAIRNFGVKDPHKTV